MALRAVAEPTLLARELNKGGQPEYLVVVPGAVSTTMELISYCPLSTLLGINT